MSDAVEIQSEEIENDDLEIADDDYGFIIDADGNLKTLFMPENIPFKAPKSIERILKIFGVADVHRVDGSSTLH